jgi:hypothetical protein
MDAGTPIPILRRTALTLAVGGAGETIAAFLGFPAALLTGPAIFVSLAALAGLQVGIAPRVRDASFVLLGVGVGATVDANAADAVMTWPLAFAALGVMLVAVMFAGQWLLRRYLGFDGRSAVLASAPGHLSFVIAMGHDTGADMLRITVAQSLRLLALTLIVPVVALAMGIEMPANALAGARAMGWGEFALLVAASVAVGLVFARLRLPAALLLGGMLCSGGAHLAGWSHGGLHPVLGAVAFVTLGTLIGTRFSGITPRAIASAAGAGLLTTLLAALFAILAAIPVAHLIAMPLATTMVAFAPGGLETMVAIGAVLGGHPGFVATCHVIRLMYLTALIPLFLRLVGDAPARAD